MANGTVSSLQIAPAGKAAMQLVKEVHAVPEKGIEDDRYFSGRGTFSSGPMDPAHEITLIESEAVEAVNHNLGRKLGTQFAPADFRRNVATRGVALNHLIDQEFFVGEVRIRGIRLCEPCAHLESLTREGVRMELLHRGGLRAQILTEGRIRVGDSIRTAAHASSPGKELIRRYYEEMWNPWNFDAADDLLAENISFRGSLGVGTKGREAFREYMRQVRRAFPDFHNTIDESVEDGDSIAARLTYQGTHRGEIFGVAPAGRSISYSGAAFFRIADGKVAEGWVLGDLLGLLRQVGAHTIP
ncbi:MAG: ester cyclase [Candidatus Acidiferrales bacterium]